DVPSVMLYGGSIYPGRFNGHDVTIQDVFEAVGRHAAGDMTDEQLDELVEAASPGSGACGGQFTANTMAMAFEVMGISPAGAAMVPAMDGRKSEVAVDAGRLVLDGLARGQRPDDRRGRPRGRGGRGPAGGPPAVGSDQAHRRAGDPAREPRSGGLRGEAGGPRAHHACRPGAGVRVRGGRDGRGHEQADPV